MHPTGAPAPSGTELLELLDWKQRVFELYAAVRSSADPHAAWTDWKQTRDELFKTHPQSPLPVDDRDSFAGAMYFDYEPRARVLADVVPAEEPRKLSIPTSHEDRIEFTRFGTATFELDSRSLSLELYWLDGYGGGLFLPFTDRTSGEETYGGGRYLLDTVKGADLGMDDGRLVLDFNFAYNPSCTFDDRWVCPLAPPHNRLPIPVRAGEQVP